MNATSIACPTLTGDAERSCFSSTGCLTVFLVEATMVLIEDNAAVAPEVRLQSGRLSHGPVFLRAFICERRHEAVLAREFPVHAVIVVAQLAGPSDNHGFAGDDSKWVPADPDLGSPPAF